MLAAGWLKVDLYPGAIIICSIYKNILHVHYLLHTLHDAWLQQRMRDEAELYLHPTPTAPN